MGRPVTIGFLATLSGLAFVGFYTSHSPLTLFAGIILLAMAGLLIRRPRR